MRLLMLRFAAVAMLTAAIASVCGAQPASGPPTLENLLGEPFQQRPPVPQASPQFPAGQTSPQPSGRSLKAVFEDNVPTVIDTAEPQRQPIPDAAKIKEAQALVRDAYRDELTASTDNAEPLVRKLLDAASQTDDVTREYAILLEAERLLFAAGDVPRAIELVRARGEAFQIDVASESIAHLRDFLRTNRTANPGLLGGLIDESLSLATTALESGRLEDAAGLVDLASQASLAVAQASAKKKLKDTLLVETASEAAKRAAALDRLIPRRIKARDEMLKAAKILESTPDDASANGIVGAYECFVAGQWGRGVERLAKSDKADLRDVAAEESRLRGLENPSAKELFRLADRWWAAGEAKGADTEFAGAAQKHAAKLYAAAVPGLSDPLDLQVAKKRAAPQNAATENTLLITLDAPPAPAIGRKLDRPSSGLRGEPKPHEWLSIFDGATKQGWDEEWGEVAVRDGVVVVKGRNSGIKQGWLRSKPAAFQASVRFVGGDKDNTTVKIGICSERDGGHFITSNGRGHGTLAHWDRELKKWTVLAVFDLPRAAADGWQTFELQRTGELLRGLVNGKEIAVLQIQVESMPDAFEVAVYNAEAAFKDLRVRSLE